MVAGPTYNDTSGNDIFSPQTGTLSGFDLNTGDTLSYGIGGGTSGGGTTIAGVTYDVAKTGSFGTLYVNSVTGQYTYQENDAAISAASTAQADDFTFTVTDLPTHRQPQPLWSPSMASTTRRCLT